METTKEILNRTNEFKRKCNIDRVNIEDFNNQVEKYTNIKLPNIVNVYRDKILELNDIFKEKGIEYFSSDCYLRVLTTIYLNIYNCKVYRELIDLVSNIKIYNFISNISDKVAEKLYQKKIKIIKENLEYINKFNINEYPELLEIVMNSETILSDLLPDCYELFCTEIINELNKLEVNCNNIDNNNLMNNITAKEKESIRNWYLNEEDCYEKFDIFRKEYDVNINTMYSCGNKALKK